MASNMDKLVVPLNLITPSSGSMASFASITSSVKPRLSKNLSYANDTSGMRNKFHCNILASKCEEYKVNGLLGCMQKDVRAREGSTTYVMILAFLMSQIAMV